MVHSTCEIVTSDASSLVSNNNSLNALSSAYLLELRIIFVLEYFIVIDVYQLNLTTIGSNQLISNQINHLHVCMWKKEIQPVQYCINK